MPTGRGPVPARIMLVGEFYSDQEERLGEAVAGQSGLEFTKVLQSAGIMRSECFVTALVHARPPFNDPKHWVDFKKKGAPHGHVPFRDRMVAPIVKQGYQQLMREIREVQPNIIVTLGNLSLWALTGALGALKWRGSQLYLRPEGDLFGDELVPPTKLIPVPSPSLMQFQEEARVMMTHDLRRVARHSTYPGLYANEPHWEFQVRPSLEQVLSCLDSLMQRVSEGPTWIELDLETRAGHIACCGLSWSERDAISIPFMCVESDDGYWNSEAEGIIVHALYRLLTHPNCYTRGQNLLYDSQYTYRHWHFIPNVKQDTMISHHTMFAGLPKALDFQASMYCDHYVFWKDDGKTWNKGTGEAQLWEYNCQDDVRTRECGERELEAIERLGLQEPHAFQQAMFYPVLKAMIRGVRVDKKARDAFAMELQEEIYKREIYFKTILGHPLNPRSAPQMTKLFYEDFGIKPIMSRATKQSPSHVTCNDEALEKIKLREPLTRPLIKAIQEFRSLGVFLSTFVLCPLDQDGRMRCSYNICGTETFRLSSSENAFGSGGNLQNIPAGGEDDDSDLVLPNVRKIYIPDEGYEMFDTDLSKADLRIVTWESDENELKAMLAEGKDPYVEMAREFYRDPSLTKNRPDGSPHPRYKTFKSFAHGTNYLGTPQGLSARLGLSVRDAEKTQAWYFGKFPKIKKWQDRIKAQVTSQHFVQNAFGYRRYYFGRIDEATFREAIAWIPQSTVGLYINRIWLELHKNYPKIEILLQVHDSLVGQFPRHIREKCLADLKTASQVVIPYDDPLIIPVGLKTSTKSWGDCA